MATAARTLLRSSALLRRAGTPAARSSSSASLPGLRFPKLGPSAPRRLLRSPVEASFCLDSLLPLHTATAAAVMTSLLSSPGRGYGWLCEGQDETR